MSGDTVYLWDVAKDAPPTRIYVASTAAVSISPGHVQLLGDADVARGLLSCRVGERLYPYVLCRDRFEP